MPEIDPMPEHEPSKMNFFIDGYKGSSVLSLGFRAVIFQTNLNMLLNYCSFIEAPGKFYFSFISCLEQPLPKELYFITLVPSLLWIITSFNAIIYILISLQILSLFYSIWNYIFFILFYSFIKLFQDSIIYLCWRWIPNNGWTRPNISDLFIIGISLLHYYYISVIITLFGVVWSLFPIAFHLFGF